MTPTELLHRAGEIEDQDERFSETLRLMIETWAFCLIRGDAFIVDGETAFTRRNLRAHFARCDRESFGPRGGYRRESPFATWLGHPERLTLDHYLTVEEALQAYRRGDFLWKNCRR